MNINGLIKTDDISSRYINSKKSPYLSKSVKEVKGKNMKMKIGILYPQN